VEIISTDITLNTNEENTVVRLDLTEEQYKDIIEKYGTKHVITRTYKKMPYELDNKNLFFKYDIRTEALEKSILITEGLATAIQKAMLKKGAFQLELTYNPEDAIARVAIYLPDESTLSDNCQEA
jgi:hypothetical protein